MTIRTGFDIRRIRAFGRALVLFSFVGLWAESAVAQDVPLFVFRDDGDKLVSRFAKEHALTRRTALIDWKAFGAGGWTDAKRVAINLSPDLLVVARQLRTDERGRRGGRSWFGRVDGDRTSDVVFTQTRDLFGGHVSVGGRKWAIVPTRTPLYEILELDDASFPGDLDNSSAVPGRAGPGNLDRRFGVYLRNLAEADDGEWDLFRRLVSVAATPNRPLQRILEDGSEVDVLVLYTDDAQSYADDPFPDPSPMVALWTQQAFDLANQALASSQIPTRLNLVTDPIRMPYQEVNIDEDLTRLRNLDGVIDGAHTWRDHYAADIVVLVTAKDGSPGNDKVCGKAAERRKAVSLSNSLTREEFEEKRAANAFAVVKAMCMIGTTYSFAHEIGHLFGGQHDRYVQPEIDSTYEDEARGFIVRSTDSGAAVRSMMANDKQCRDAKPSYDCPKVLRFSSPDDTSQFGLPFGIPVGLAGAADVRSVITRNSVWVAQYRWWGCRHIPCFDP
jgi:hypothetical protein